MENNIVIETIGFLAAAIIIFSMTLKSYIQFRLINMVGSIFFILYCYTIGSYPLLALYSILALINMFYLLLYYNRTGFFRILMVNKNSTFLNEFLLFYYSDIIKYFPKFMSPYDEEFTYFYILRNMVTTGILVVKVNLDETAEIVLDYVIPEYRDSKIGSFVYNENDNYFKDIGIQTFLVKEPTRKQLRYIKSNGFRKSKADPNVYEKKIKKTW